MAIDLTALGTIACRRIASRPQSVRPSLLVGLPMTIESACSIMRSLAVLEDVMAAKDPPQSDEPTKRSEADEARYQKVLAELKAEWDARLRACFDAPDFGERVEAMMDACGRTKVRPKAGETF